MQFKKSLFDIKMCNLLNLNGAVSKKQKKKKL